MIDGIFLYLQKIRAMEKSVRKHPIGIQNFSRISKETRTVSEWKIER